MPPHIPQKMDPEIEILIVVGYKHCGLAYQEIACALGYRPDKTTLYYPWRQVKEAYERLRANPKNSTYSIWGPEWARRKGRDRIDQRKINKKKALIDEGRRRARFTEKQAALRLEEQSRRKSAWCALQGYRSEGDWHSRDSLEMGWNALAERSRR